MHELPIPRARAEHWLWLCTATLLSLALAACGGGGGGGATVAASSGTTGSTGTSNSCGAASSAGAAGSGVFWVAFQAVPSTAGGAGPNGVYVVPSNALTATPQAVGTQTAPSELALGYANSASSSSYAPATALYSATVSGGVQCLYGLDLASAALPTPMPIGTPLPAGEVVCPASAFNAAQTNFYDPTTVFVVLDLSGPSGSADCGNADNTYVVAHYTDGVGVALSSVPSNAFYYYPVYQNGGALAGLIFEDGSGNLVYSTATTFSNPQPLVAGGGDFSLLYQNPTQTTLVISVATTSGQTQVYAVSAMGGALTASLLYSATGAIGNVIADANAVYFTDTGTTKVSIVEAPLNATSGSQVQVLYSAPSAAYTLIGSTGTQVVAALPGTASTTIEELPVGATASSPNVLGTVPGTLYTAFLDSTGTYLYVNSRSGTGYTGDVLTLNPLAMLQSTSASFLFPATSGAAGMVIQVKGVTDSNGGLGGGTVYQLNTATLAATPFTTSGTPYVLPAGSFPNFYGISSTGIGVAYLTSVSTDLSVGGAVYDATQNSIVPLSVQNSTATLYAAWD